MSKALNFSIHLPFDQIKSDLVSAKRDLLNQIILDSTPFVPFNQGVLSNSVHIENDDEIVWGAPYARFLHEGKLMLDERGSSWAKKGGRKFVTNKNLIYSKESHPKATSHWFEKAKNLYLDDWIKILKKVVK